MAVLNSSGAVAREKPVRSSRLQQEARIGMLFLAPWIIGFVLLKALPILAAFVFS